MKSIVKLQPTNSLKEGCVCKSLSAPTLSVSHSWGRWCE